MARLGEMMDMAGGVFEPLGLWAGKRSEQTSAQQANDLLDLREDAGRGGGGGGGEVGEGGGGWRGRGQLTEPLPRLLQGTQHTMGPMGEGEGREGGRVLGREGKKTEASAVLMMVRDASWSHRIGPSWQALKMPQSPTD